MREATVETRRRPVAARLAPAGAVPARAAPAGTGKASPARRNRMTAPARPAPRSARLPLGQKIAGAVFALLLVGIVANAVVLQNGPHPAPLFGHGKRLGPPAGQREAARTAPAPQAAGAAGGPVPTEPAAAADAAPAEAVQAPPAPAPLQLHPAAARPSDAIGQWLRRGAKPQPGTVPAGMPAAPRTAPRPPPAPTAKQDGITRLLREAAPAGPGRGAAPAADTMVLAAQRRLAKLGYVVNPDGRMGDATRRAIEKFERDRHHTVAAGVTPQLLHDLGAATPPPG